MQNLTIQYLAFYYQLYIFIDIVIIYYFILLQLFSIYHINPDYERDPYQSVLVVWVNQDFDRQWMYKYEQTDNECSPWELFLSDYILLSSVKPYQFPENIVNTTNGSNNKTPGMNIKPMDILLFLKKYVLLYIFIGYVSYILYLI